MNICSRIIAVNIRFMCNTNMKQDYYPFYITEIDRYFDLFNLLQILYKEIFEYTTYDNNKH